MKESCEGEIVKRLEKSELDLASNALKVLYWGCRYKHSGWNNFFPSFCP